MNTLLAAVLFLQDKTAEATFQKLEEQIEKAQTVSMAFNYEWKRQDAREAPVSRFQGKLWISQDNKVSIQTDNFDGNRKDLFELRSDGKRMVCIHGSEASEILSAPIDLHSALRVGFSRSGIHLAWDRIAQSVRVGAKSPPIDPKGVFLASAWIKGEDEGDAKTLLYRLEVRETSNWNVRLVYDPKSYQPLKRTLRKISPLGPDALIEPLELVEVYSNVTFNAEIPEGTFEVPNDEGSKKVKDTRVMMFIMSEALDLYKVDHDAYPANLKDLVTRPAGIEEKRYPPHGYLHQLPKDAWGREFIYRVPGTNGEPYDLISLGEDGKEGGDGEAADIWNHDAFKKK